MNNVIATIIKFTSVGVDKVSAGLTGIGNAAKVGIRSLTALAGSLGSAGGSIGKAAGQVANFMWSVQQMGAIGGIVAGAQMIISQVSDHFIKKADAMVEAARRMSEQVRARFEEIKAKSLEEINEQLAKATTLADRAAARFDALAAAYLKVEGAKAQAAKAGGSAVLSGLALEREEAMAAAGDKDKRAIVGAEYDVRIAREGLDYARLDGDNSVAAAKQEAKDANARSKAASRTEREARRAAEKAADELGNYRYVEDQSKIEDLRRKKDEADAALAKATNDRIAKTAAAAAADENVAAAERNRLAAILDHHRSLVAAETSLKDLKNAQAEAAKAMRERQVAEEQAARVAAEKERAAAEKAYAAAEKEKAEAESRTAREQMRSASAEVSRWQGEFDRSFDLWRNPEAAAQAVESDKKRAEDMRRFRKEVNRYGGKGKIDEAARLMREGDEEGLQSRLEQWRKSARFTPQVEQMVKAAAADQNKNSAEKSLAEIAKNTENLDKKLDQLLALK